MNQCRGHSLYTEILAASKEQPSPAHLRVVIILQPAAKQQLQQRLLQVPRREQGSDTLALSTMAHMQRAECYSCARQNATLAPCANHVSQLHPAEMPHPRTRLEMAIMRPTESYSCTQPKCHSCTQPKCHPRTRLEMSIMRCRWLSRFSLMPARELSMRDTSSMTRNSITHSSSCRGGEGDRTGVQTVCNRMQAGAQHGAQHQL